MTRGALGRRPPPDWDHYAAYPLTIATTPTVPVPVAIGVNWYTDFDTPVRKGGRWWIGLDPRRLGTVRGGHCVVLEPGDQVDANGAVVRNLQDTTGWWDFYDQGSEGACVGFGCSRMMTLLNRKRYDARWLWDKAKLRDQWPDTRPGDDNGTSVRAACAALAEVGHVPWRPEYEGRDWVRRATEMPVPVEGIGVYRWASSVSAVHAALQGPSQDRLGAVRILNSWGRGYEHRVWMPDETLQRLLDEDGEAAVITDN